MKDQMLSPTYVSLQKRREHGEGGRSQRSLVVPLQTGASSLCMFVEDVGIGLKEQVNRFVLVGSRTTQTKALWFLAAETPCWMSEPGLIMVQKYLQTHFVGVSRNGT